MLRRYATGLVLMALLIAGVYVKTGQVTASDTPASPSVQYLDAILGAIDHIEGNLPLIIETAEQAADHLMAGGDLYATGTGFASEAISRSGGIMMVRSFPITAAESLYKEHNVVLFGVENETARYASYLQTAREVGMLFIVFSSGKSPYREHAEALINNGFPLGTGPVVTVEGWSEPICPAGPASNITAMWTFTGELVTALTRRGEMPVMGLSILMEGARDRLSKYEPYAYHEDMEIAPVPPGQLGQAYLAEIRRCLQGMRDHQIPGFQKGGRMIANTIHAGHKAWILVRGHHLPSQLGIPGDPGVMDASLATNRGKLLTTIGPEDGLVYVGYYGFPEYQWDEEFQDMGIPLVVITGGRETKPVTPRRARST